MHEGGAAVDAAWALGRSRAPPPPRSQACPPASSPQAGLPAHHGPPGTRPGLHQSRGRSRARRTEAGAPRSGPPVGSSTPDARSRSILVSASSTMPASSPALLQGEVSASTQHGQPSGSKACAPSLVTEGGFPGWGATTTQLKSVPLLLGGQLRRPGPGTATRARAPGMRQIHETRL